MLNLAGVVTLDDHAVIREKFTKIVLKELIEKFTMEGGDPTPELHFTEREGFTLRFKIIPYIKSNSILLDENKNFEKIITTYEEFPHMETPP